MGAGGAGLAAFGRLLLDGELRVRAHEDQKLRSRYVFVFDKLMLLCKPVKVSELYVLESRYEKKVIFRRS